MSDMTLIALLLGAFIGFFVGAGLVSPRMWYRGELAGQTDNPELRGYLQDFVLGIVGALMGMVIAALAVTY